MPKKTRRSQCPYPALTKRFNLKNRQDEIDFDYLSKLTPEELDWLNRFMEEEHNASFKHSNQVDGSPEARRASYARNNARNRDLYLTAKIRGFVVDMDDKHVESYIEKNQRADISEEDVWIRKLDGKEFPEGEDESDDQT